MVSNKYRNPLYISYYFSSPGLRFCLLKKKDLFLWRGGGCFAFMCVCAWLRPGHQALTFHSIYRLA